MSNNIDNVKPVGKKYFVNDFFYELFYVLTGALIIFVCIEIFWPGIVLAHLNINYILIFWLISGIIILH